jgi:hypothetical protein
MPVGSRRSNRQRCVSAARGRPQLRLPRRQGGRAGEGARALARCPRGTQPGSKRPIERHSVAAWQGFGGAEPPKRAPAHASPARHCACPACTRSACCTWPLAGRCAWHHRLPSVAATPRCPSSWHAERRPVHAEVAARPVVSTPAASAAASHQDHLPRRQQSTHALGRSGAIRSAAAGLTLTQEPGGITVQTLARGEERPQRTRGRSGTAASMQERQRSAEPP